MNLLITFTHDSELQALNNIIADLHTLQITTAPAKPFPAFCSFTSRSLATASNNEDYSASHAQVKS
jgi:hypothetical protein